MDSFFDFHRHRSNELSPCRLVTLVQGWFNVGNVGPALGKYPVFVGGNVEMHVSRSCFFLVITIIMKGIILRTTPFVDLRPRRMRMMDLWVCRLPGKFDTLIQCCFNAGPAAQTLAQH